MSNNNSTMRYSIKLAEFDNVNFTVQQFIDKVNEEFNKFYQHQDYGKVVRDRGRNRDVKKFIEELLPLQKYLIFRCDNRMRSETIKWKGGSQKGDATLNTNETIEITVAEHKKEYITREHINKTGFAFCAEGAFKEKGITSSAPVVRSPEDRIRSHTEMIVNAINKKLRKYKKIDSLIVFLNQDGLLDESEFKAIIENVRSVIALSNNINNIFIWSFQYQVFANNNVITIHSS